MRFSNVVLPKGLEKVGETPVMNQENVFPGILEKHMAPKNKWGKIVVISGSLNYVWEDNVEDILKADINNPIVIEPERYHHVILTGEVKFKVEFYMAKQNKKNLDERALRPGQNFI